MNFNKLIKKSQQILPLINPDNRCLHCSFLLDKNKIVSFGYNDSFSTHPIGKRYDFRYNNIHSELSAILRAKWYVDKLHKLTLVNVRFKRSGELGLSKPCTRCQEMLKDFGITNIYYTLEDGQFAQM